MWVLAQSLGDGHRSLVTLEKGVKRVYLRFDFLFPHQLQAFCLKFLVNFSHTRFIGLVITSAYCSQ